MMFDKLVNVFKLDNKDAKNRIIKAYSNAEKRMIEENKGFDVSNSQARHEFLDSRSCYKQWYRMFNTKEVDNKTVTKESRELIEIIKKANFDIMKCGNNISEGVIAAMKFLKKLEKENPLEVQDSIIEIYFDTIEVLRDKKLLDKIKSYNSKLVGYTKGGIIPSNIKSQSDEDMQKIYKYSFLVSSYASLLMFAMHLTAQFGTVSLVALGDQIDYQKDSKITYTQAFLNEYMSRYKYFFYQVALKHIDLIVYFKRVNWKKLETTLNNTFTEEVSKEEFNNGYREKLGVESVTLAIVIAIGVGLGLITILPLIRAMIYYWGSLKIDLARYFKDEAIFLSFNVERLIEERNATTDKAQREKLDKIIADQSATIEKLKQWSIKMGLDYEDTIKTVETVAEADTVAENDSYTETYQPNILI